MLRQYTEKCMPNWEVTIQLSGNSLIVFGKYRGRDAYYEQLIIGKASN